MAAIGNTTLTRGKRQINLVAVFWLVGGALTVLKNTPIPLDIGWAGIIAFFWVPALAVLVGAVLLKLAEDYLKKLLQKRLEKAVEEAREHLRHTTARRPDVSGTFEPRTHPTA